MIRQTWCVVSAVLALFASAACAPEDRKALEEANARLNEERLFEFADEHLSDDDLAAAVPAGFEFIDVKRHGYDRHHKEWVTVGVRMEGPVRFARAIFYVHPDEDSAHAEFVRQTGVGGQAAVAENGGFDEPWMDERLDIPTFCSAQGDHLFWCHAHKGNVQLVIQSAAGWPTRKDATREERQAAEDLLRAFGTYLQHEIPEE